MSESNKDGNKKDNNYWSILNAVIRLEVTKGHLLWKMTDLSRLSGVGRPLIYYYFGNSKDEIVQAAMKIIGDEFFGFSDERMELWKRGDVMETVSRTRALLEKAPFISVFYFHWRHQTGEIADHLRGLERRYFEKLSSVCPQFSQAQIEALFSALFGATVFPQLSEEGLREILKRFGF